MNNVYDNGTMIIGELNKVIDYVIKNSEENWENEDLIKDLEDLKQFNGVIVCVNYDLGMGYGIEWWENSHIVEIEEKEDNMKKEQLLDKMYNYYKKGIKNVDMLIDLKKEIRDNLETLEGIEEELDSCRIEFDMIRVSDKKYEEIQEIWNDLNNLKTEYERQGA